MKTIELKYPVILLLLITCMSFISPNANKRNVIGIPIHRPDTIKRAKTVFVIDRNGVEIKQHPDTASETVGSYSFGDSFEVINSQNGWLAIRRDTALEYVKQSSTGKETDIPLTNKDLTEVFYEGDNKPKPYRNIKLTLVSKKEFDRMKKIAVNYLKLDTNVIKKHNGIIKLPLKKGVKKYIDKADEYENNYNGQYPILNKYIMSYSWYEAEITYYNFIDKTTGKSGRNHFEGIPILSNDKKSIMCVSEYISIDCSRVLVYKIRKNAITPYAGFQFKNWQPAQDQTQFWGNDNCYYLPVIPSIIYNQHYTNLHSTIGPYIDYNLRYVKIRITGPNKINY